MRIRSLIADIQEISDCVKHQEKPQDMEAQRLWFTLNRLSKPRRIVNRYCLWNIL